MRLFLLSSMIAMILVMVVYFSGSVTSGFEALTKGAERTTVPMSRNGDAAHNEEEVLEGLQSEVETLKGEIGALTERLEYLEGYLAASMKYLRAYELPAKMDFAGEAVPLDRWDLRERLEREFFLSLSDRGQVILWLKRSARYFPYIEAELAKKGLPDDLKYIAVIESSLLPKAYSRARALGIWQIIGSTGRHYGLTITRFWDERRDPQRSTAAALAYLNDLCEQFNSWALALAAYNVGEKRVKLELERQGVQSYYQLALPAETSRYVFRALAAKLILSDPEKYGFHVQKGQLYQQKEADLVEVRVRRRLFVKEIAEASGSFYREIMELNPAIVKDYIPTGFYMIRLPKGAATQFFANNPKLLMRMAHRDQTDSMVQYCVKEGDTLMHIAQRFGVSVNSLKQWNEAARKRYLYPGETLVIYEKGSAP